MIIFISFEIVFVHEIVGVFELFLFLSRVFDIGMDVVVTIGEWGTIEKREIVPDVNGR